MAASKSKSQKQALKKLEDQLTCAICLDAFKDPKMLQCFHVYCKECLERLVVQDQQGRVSVSCPTCRRSTLLPPPSTLADLQAAFHIHHLFDIRDAFEKVKEPEKVQCGLCTKVTRAATAYCRDCGEFICTQCVDSHTNWVTLAKHEVVALDQFEKKVKQLDALKKVTLYCSLHEGKELELYCETCEELICLLCTVKKHKDHQYDLVSDTFDRQKAEIVASLEPVNVHLETTNKAIKQVDTQSKAVKANMDAADTEIDKEIDKLQNILELRRAELKAEVKEVGQMKLKNLATQREEMETVETQLVSCLSVVQESLRTGSKGEVMKMKKGVVRQIKEITGSIKADQLSPCESADIAFTASPELAQSCELFGVVGASHGHVSAKDSYATGKGLQVAVRGEKATAVVHVCDEEGKVYPKPVESLSCELASDSSAEKVKGTVKKIKEGHYEMSYQATSRGRHQLHIKVKGDHIKGSPFPVIVKLPVRELGTPDRTISGLNRPWGVAINKRSEILVSERDRNLVSIFSPTGQKIRSFGSQDSGQGQFSGPYGIAVDGDQNILVADTGNHRIQKFSSDGRFIAAVGTNGSGQLQFSSPVGIKINPRSKRIYVADQCNNRIQVLQPDLTFLSSFGCHGNGPGQLHNPYDIAFDSANNVYVADCYNHRVQVFTENGEYLRQIGKQGTGKGELNYAAMIYIDDEDKIFVSSNHFVSVFTSLGEHLTSFGAEGNGPQQFHYPRGMAVDKAGMLYVCDCSNNRVQIF